MLTKDEIDELIRRIVVRSRPTKVIIFGSYAKGTATIHSDLDVFVVTETDLPMARRTDDLEPMLCTVLIPVDLHVYTPQEVEEYAREEFSFVSNVLRWGETIYEAQPGVASDMATFD
jgi:predicted nucleotidyltransferase